MEQQVEAEMPRYISHKQVWALELDCVDHNADGSSVLTFRDNGYSPILIPASSDIFARYKPVQGDFYVVYADGYKSFSPRKAFLEGYVKLPSGSQQQKS
jgi:hypothetical protein